MSSTGTATKVSTAMPLLKLPFTTFQVQALNSLGTGR